MTHDNPAQGLAGGVLPLQQLRSAVEADWITVPAAEIGAGQLQPASLDLRLGETAYRIRSSFLPGQEPVAEKLACLTMYELALTPAAILERGHAYLIPLLEELALPDHIYGKANPKSSTGRLDVFTRVITDAHSRFDDIRPGYRGRLYLEIFPRSFTIKVCHGLSLNQLRLFTGIGTLDDRGLSRLYETQPLFYGDDDRPLPLSDVHVDGGLFMSVETAGRDGDIIGYKARKNSDIIDLAQVGFYDPSDFWEPIRCVSKRPLILEPEEFYILASRERVCVPPDHAAELMAYDAGSGELRTHYAGFFDPGFGYGGGARRGAKAVLEVRPHDVPFLVEDGQLFCKLCLERTTEMPETTYGEGLASHYQGQTLKLSKQFRPWL
jgi:dCTP deaminase